MDNMQSKIWFSDHEVTLEAQVAENPSLFRAFSYLNQEFFVKQYSIEAEEDRYKSELEAYTALERHPNLVSLQDYSETLTKFNIIYEGGLVTLESLLSKENVPQGRLIEIIIDVCRGLQYMHSRHYIHRNLTISSIFLSTDGTAKIGNLESGILQEKLRSLYGIELSENIDRFTFPSSRAPELIDFTPEFPIGVETDMWAFGCIIVEILTGSPAFPVEATEDQLLGKYHVPPGIKIPQIWSDLLAKLLCPDPRHRATPIEVIRAVEEPRVKTKERLSLGFFNKSTKRWVRAATSDNENPPENLFITKLIAKAWKKPFKIQKFVKAIVKRPFNKTAVSIKSLIVLHKYFISGPSDVFGNEVAGVLEKIGTKGNRNDKYASENTKRIIETYANLLTKKNAFHSGTQHSKGSWVDIELTMPSIYDLLSYWQDIKHLGMITLDNFSLVELCQTIVLNLIEEQQRLSQAILQALTYFPPKEETVELSQMVQERHTNMQELIRAFRNKFPLAYLPVNIQQSSEMSVGDILKNRRASLPYFFENKVVSKQNSDSIVSQSTHLFSVASEETMVENAHVEDTKLEYFAMRKSEVIGVGSSCTVYNGFYKSSKVAIKIMRANKSSIMKEFNRELEVLTRLKHPNLVNFVGACTEPEMCIVTEYCAGDTIFGLLHENRKVKLSWAQKLKMALDVAQGMAYLHSQGVIHRDLKSLNLLLANPVLSIKDEITVKITDFGISRIFDESGLMTGQMGTSHWMAPEVLESLPYSLKADVYSFGIVLWEIVARETPYRNLTAAMIPHHVVHLGARPDMRIIPSTCPGPYKDLITSCLLSDPSSRPSFHEIVVVLKSLINFT